MRQEQTTAVRALFIFGSDCADYLLDLTLDGFRQVLGPQNVSWWPDKPHLTAVPPERVPERLCWFEGPYEPAHDLITALQGIVAGDIVVVGATHDHAAAELQATALVDLIRNEVDDVLIVGLDGGDQPAPEWAARLRDRAGAEVFLREQIAPHAYASRPIALPFNPRFVAPAVPWNERRCTALWAGARHSNRAAMLDAITRAAEVVPALLDFTQPVALSGWAARLASTAICLCLPGAGVQTYRQFEAAASGALVLTNALGGGYADLARDESALLFETSEEAVAQIARLITSEGREELARIAATGYVNAWTHHTPAATARYILDTART